MVRQPASPAALRRIKPQRAAPPGSRAADRSGPPGGGGGTRDDRRELARGRAVQDHAVARRGRTARGSRRTHCAGEPVARRREPLRRGSAWRCARAARSWPSRRSRRGSCAHHRVGAEALEHVRIPAVGLHHQVAVRLQVGREASDRLLEPQRLGRGDRRPSRSTTRRAPRAGSRPAFSAACFTVRTQRAVVSSVKKVCSTTASKTRPPSASEFGPNAVSMSGISLVELGVEMAAPDSCPAGPSWPTIDLAAPEPAHQSGEVLELRGRDARACRTRSNMRPMPRPSPSAKRPPVSRCMVVANDAVTIGWRVLWLVAAVAMPMARRHRADRAGERAGLLDVEALGDEHAPRPSASASRTSSMQRARRLARRRRACRSRARSTGP